MRNVFPKLYLLSAFSLKKKVTPPLEMTEKKYKINAKYNWVSKGTVGNLSTRLTAQNSND